jgi:hypothetical protein
MLRSVNEMLSYVLLGKDGEIGRCKDFLFDDRTWTIRYMVADTNKWLPGQKVLISPISLGDPDWRTKRFPIKLTKKQIEKSPPLDEDAPISRQYELKWFRYYGYPNYWSGMDLWGASAYPAGLYVERKADILEEQRDEDDAGLNPEKSHLRSVWEVNNYRIQAVDEEIGRVKDFIVDDQNWRLCYVVVDTRNWLPGRKVLMSPAWVTEVNWAENKVHVAVTAAAVKESPAYDPAAPVNREYETRLYDYYGRPYYWE